MAADEKVLSTLHTVVAQALIAGVKGSEITGDEGVVVALPPSPAMLQAAIKFLKDNDVTCAPSDDNATGELASQLKKRRAEGAMPRELADALDDLSHSAHRPN